MRAAARTRYGPPDVVHTTEAPNRVPKAGEILVRVRAAAVSSGDAKMRGFTGIPAVFWLPGRIMAGLTRPRQPILGSAFAGEIAALGKGAVRFKPGERVFGFTGLAFGAHAEHLTMPEDGAVTGMPGGLPFTEAAAIPFGGLTALCFLREARLRAGERILILGASGAVGAAAVQLAKQMGAEAVGVCSSSNIDAVQSLGADHVIDYTQEDFTHSGPYDVVFDTVGASHYAAIKPILRQGGRCVFTVFALRELMQMLWTSRIGSRKVLCAVTNEKLDDLVFLKDRIEAGELRAVIDSLYPLDAAAEAHRRVDSGHKVGSVVLTLEDE